MLPETCRSKTFILFSMLNDQPESPAVRSHEAPGCERVRLALGLCAAGPFVGRGKTLPCSATF